LVQNSFIIVRHITHIKFTYLSIINNIHIPLHISIKQSERIYQMSLKKEKEIENIFSLLEENQEDKTIQELFEEQVLLTPDKVAAVFEKSCLTYDVLNKKANQLAYHLRAKGVKQETLVAICVGRSLDLVVGLIGILKAGGAYVPLDPSYPTDRLKFILKDTQTPILLTQSNFKQMFEDYHGKVIFLDEPWNDSSIDCDENLDPISKPNHLAYVIYTSGTTGTPKGVLTEHHSITSKLLHLIHTHNINSTLNIAAKIPLVFDPSLREIFLALLSGAKLIIIPDEVYKDMEKLKEFFIKTEINLFVFVPSHLQAFLDSLKENKMASEVAAKIKILYVCGEVLSPKLVMNIKDFFPNIIIKNQYGPTECCMFSFEFDARSANLFNKTIPIGSSLYNTTFYILDKNLNRVPIGEIGELYIGGEGLARGYLNNPSLTAEKFVANPFTKANKNKLNSNETRLYKTGDLVRELSDGNLEYIGRNDFQVKFRGFRIELGEIEDCMRNHPLVKNVVVILREDKPQFKQLVAYWISNKKKNTKETSKSISKIREFLTKELPDYMIPAIFVQLETMPLTPNGKIDRETLPIPVVGNQLTEYEPPQSEIEKKLAKIWSEVLHVEKVGRNDNFFSLGGHSLLATQIIARIRRDLNIEFPLHSLFEDSILKRFANKLKKFEGKAVRKIKPELKHELRPLKIPLSFAQSRLWFLEKLIPNSSLYNIADAIILKGEIHVDNLERALNEIVARHEVLRTSLPEIEEQAIQKIIDKLYLPLVYEDLTSFDESIRYAIAQEKGQLEKELPFNLDKGPLIRWKLIKLKSFEYLFLITVHHIVFDGWSKDVFYQELSTLYNNFNKGKPSPLKPLSIQYVDYTLWQRQWLQGEVLDKQLSYWKEQLSGIPELINLPIDRARPSEEAYKGATFKFKIPASLAEKITKLSETQSTTMFMTLLAVFQVLLYRYTQQDDIVTGTPIAHRQEIEIENLIGFFVNTLVIHGRLGENTSFIEFLQQIRETTLGAYAHQDVPFEQLVEQLEVSRSLSYHPLFQVMFVFQAEDSFNSKLTLNNVEIDSWDTETTTSKFDLTLNIIDYGIRQGMSCFFEYNTDIFDKLTLERMAKCYLTLLEGIVNSPAQKIGKLPFLSHEEEQKIIVQCNFSDVSYQKDKTIHELFEAQVKRNPHHVALTYEEKSLTYQELNEHSNQLAHLLRKEGVMPDTLVAIICERSLEMMIGILGILKAGGAYVPIEPTSPLDRLQFILEDTKSSILLTQEHLVNQLSKISVKKILINNLHNQNLPTDNPSPVVKPSHLAYIIYTSGSTGMPKGVMIPHCNVHRLFSATVEWYKFNEHDVWTLFHSYAFDFSVWEIWGALLYGGRLVVVPHFVTRSITDFYQLLLQEKVTILNQTPSAFYQLIVHLETLSSKEKIPSLRKVIFGGEALNFQKLLPWFKRNGDQCPILINMYGITETTVHVSYAPICMKNINSSSQYSNIGRIIPDLKAYVLSSSLQPMPIGVIGELYIGGEGVARGYLNRPDLTMQRFIVNPFLSLEERKEGKNLRLYKTGDLCRWLEDGTLEYIGRNDFQVKIRGFRIELGEIEAILLKHPLIKEAFVMAREDGIEHKRLVAYIVLKGDKVKKSKKDSTTNDVNVVLKNFLKELLPEYMVPSAIVILRQIPLTINGKIDTKSLPAPDYQNDQMKYEAPRTEREEILCEIWKEVLKVDKVGIYDNFFSLGGDSILTIQIIARCQNRGLYLTAKDFFKYQTISGLSKVIKLKNSHIAKAEQGTLKGSLPLTPIQQWFFEQKLSNMNDYNQSIFLTIKESWSFPILQEALNQLLIHHDVLRLRFKKENKQWEQFYCTENLVPLSIFDLSSLDTSEKLLAIERQTSELETSFNIENGPIFRAVWFDLGLKDSAQLYLVAHHLAIDGVSWRILVEDLINIYKHLRNSNGLQGNIQLSEKTSSYRQWAQHLITYAKSNLLQKEIPYWLRLSNKTTPSLPAFDNEAKNTRETTNDIIAVSLSRELTKHLLFSISKVYHTQINDILLAALALFYKKLTGINKLLVDLEGHGREDIFPDINILRTIGWFTSIFPVYLEMPESDGLGDLIKSVKEQIRAIPQKGIGFGILRYLNPEFRQHLNSIPNSEIRFNYLGQFEQAKDSNVDFRWAEQVKEDINLNKMIPKIYASDYMIDIIGVIENDQLKLKWTFDTRFKRETIEYWASNYIATLTQLIHHCINEPKGGCTPSDFPFSSLTQLELDGIIGNRDLENIYLLSPTQEAMLFYTLHYTVSDEYFVQSCIKIQDKLEISAFKEAWKQVIENHSILRTGFMWGGIEKPHQFVQKEVLIPFTEVDCRHLLAGEQQEKLEEFLVSDRRKGFELDKAPLMRLVLIQFDSKYYLIFSHHHIILDGWSIQLLFQEVQERYREICKEDFLPHPKTHPYIDYISWLQGQDLEAAEKFWQEYLDNFNTITRLPIVDDSIKISDDYRSYHFDLSSFETNKLKDLAIQYQITFNVVIQTAWAILLHHYTQQDDIIFGITSSGRPSEISGIEQMIGMFINTLPLRVDFASHSTILDIFKQIQKKLPEITHYEYMPLSKIQNLVDTRPEALFDNILVFENYPSYESSNEILKMDVIKHFERVNYPIILHVEPGDYLKFIFYYDNAQIESKTIERMACHLRNIIKNLLENSTQLINEISFTSTDELRSILGEWSKSAIEFPRNGSVIQIFEEQVKKSPDNIALVFEDKKIFYRELNEKANQLAHYFIDKKIKTGDRIGVGIKSSDTLFVVMLSIFKIGATYVPLDPNCSQDRLSDLLSDCAAKFYLTIEKEKIEKAPCPSIVINENFWKKEINAHSKENLNFAFPDNIPCYIIYTSGSTGKPKGVEVSQKSLLNLIYCYRECFKINVKDKTCQYASPVFDAFFCETWPYITIGAEIHLLNDDIRLSPDLLLNFFKEKGITFCDIPTAIAIHLFQISWPQGLKLRGLKIGGEKLTRYPVHSLPCDIWNTYGPTESTVEASYYLFSKANQIFSEYDIPRMPIIGKSLPNIKLYILDKYFSPVPIGIPGELHIGGEGLALGYLNDAYLNAQKFIPNPFSDKVGERLYCTGDLCRFLPDGNIEFIGRFDNQVKIRGFRIELGEIESCIRSNPMVRESVVVLREDISGFKKLVAYWVSRKTHIVEEELALNSKINEYLTKRLPDYMIPNAFVKLESFPLTISGKIDRKALPEPVNSNSQKLTEYEAPQSEVECKLERIWSEVLHVEKVGRKDNFFKLGGDSILSMVLVFRCRQENIHLKTKDIFENPTIQQLSLISNTPVLIKAEQKFLKGSFPLTPRQLDYINSDLNTRCLERCTYIPLLTIKKVWKKDAVEMILRFLLSHHDALRTRFFYQDGNWKQFYSDSTDINLLPFDLRSFDSREQLLKIEEVRKKMSNSLNIINGPVFMASRFELGKDNFKLLFVAHHLITDAYSWQILVEDFQQLCQQHMVGKPLELPPKTSSYRQRVLELIKYANSEEILNELPYWETFKDKKMPILPENTNSHETDLELINHFSYENTQLVLNDLPSFYNASFNEILLTILTLSFQEWSKQTGFWLLIWANGRQQIEQGNDYSRTIGWYNYLYPSYLEIVKENQQNYPVAIQSIKHQILAIPNKGIGFALLKYLSYNENVRDVMNNIPRCLINFNHRGKSLALIDDLKEFSIKSTNEQHERSFDINDSLAEFLLKNINELEQFDELKESSEISKENAKDEIRIEVDIINNKLQISWYYHDRRYIDNRISEWSEIFVKILNEMITEVIKSKKMNQ